MVQNNPSSRHSHATKYNSLGTILFICALLRLHGIWYTIPRFGNTSNQPAYVSGISFISSSNFDTLLMIEHQFARTKNMVKMISHFGW